METIHSSKHRGKVKNRRTCNSSILHKKKKDRKKRGAWSQLKINKKQRVEEEIILYFGLQRKSREDRGRCRTPKDGRRDGKRGEWGKGVATKWELKKKDETHKCTKGNAIRACKEIGKNTVKRTGRVLVGGGGKNEKNVAKDSSGS